MPSFDFEFNNKDRDLILSQEGYNFADLDVDSLNNFNYVRIIVFSNNNQVAVTGLPSDSISGINGKAIFFSSLTTFNTPNNLLINTSPFYTDVEFKSRFLGSGDLY